MYCVRVADAGPIAFENDAISAKSPVEFGSDAFDDERRDERRPALRAVRLRARSRRVLPSENAGLTTYARFSAYADVVPFAEPPLTPVGAVKFACPP